MTETAFTPGMRVRALDPSLYRDDRETPAATCVRAGVVVDVLPYRHVGGWERTIVRVRFDHRPGAVDVGSLSDWLLPE